MNKYAAIGSPCLQPLSILKNSDFTPACITEAVIFLFKILIHSMNPWPKPKYCIFSLVKLVKLACHDNKYNNLFLYTNMICYRCVEPFCMCVIALVLELLYVLVLKREKKCTLPLVQSIQQKRNRHSSSCQENNIS